ncbi:MAG: hypothetical protein L6R40_008254 [Gallowayella cf. fulva]|nr:MAG: hypothetical protein L6R40_008254 [Xanthomendoza cf. fulva]
MVASGVWAGDIPLERAHSLQEIGPDRRTMKQELERIGYLGEANASYQTMPLGGPQLQANNRKIGIVHGVQAYGWHTITVKGHDCHTGTTDFVNRADALLCAAKMILHSHRLAVKYEALASTGIIKSSPGSTNTVPGWVQFSLDIRASRDDVLLDMEEHLKSDFDKIAKGDYVNGLNDDLGVFGRPCTTEWTLDAPSRAIRFDSSCINSVRQSADDVLGHRSKDLVQDMISGAAFLPADGARPQ